jgi:hypothetical protein
LIIDIYAIRPYSKSVNAFSAQQKQDLLYRFKGLLQIINDVVDVFGSYGKSDGIRLDSQNLICYLEIIVCHSAQGA